MEATLKHIGPYSFQSGVHINWLWMPFLTPTSQSVSPPTWAEIKRQQPPSPPADKGIRLQEGTGGNLWDVSRTGGIQNDQEWSWRGHNCGNGRKRVLPGVVFIKTLSCRKCRVPVARFNIAGDVLFRMRDQLSWKGGEFCRRNWLGEGWG